MLGKRLLILLSLAVLTLLHPACKGGNGNNSNGNTAGNSNGGGAEAASKTVVLWWDVTRSLQEAEKDTGLDWAVKVISDLPPGTSYYLLPIHSETQRPAPLDQGKIPPLPSREVAILFRGEVKKRVLKNVKELKDSIQADKGGGGYVQRDRRTCILNTINYSASIIGNRSEQSQPEIIYISDMIEDCFHQGLRGGKGGYIQLTQPDIDTQIGLAQLLHYDDGLKNARVTVAVPTATSGSAPYQRPDMEGLKKFWRAVFEKCGLNPENLHWTVGVQPASTAK